MDIIINTFGSSISKNGNGFVITTPNETRRIDTDCIKTIQICSSAQITSDAIMLAIEHEIPVLFVDNRGAVIGRIWSPKYGSISTIRKGQLLYSMSKDAIDLTKQIIVTKIENQQALLDMMVTNDIQVTKVKRANSRMDNYKNKIIELDGENIRDIASSLRGWEGLSSKIYFDTMNLFVQDNYKSRKRSQHPAKDVLNALLNYGYGILYGKVESCLINAGIDPYVGILHRDEYKKPVFVYDVIELYRVWVDCVVYTLVIDECITDECYTVKTDGSYWIEPSGRRLVIESLNDYMDETIRQNGRNCSRSQHISLYAQSLAQRFKSFIKTI